MTFQTKISTLVFLLLSFLASAQMEEYNYARELNGVSEQWQTVVLPDDIYGHLTENLRDLRLYGITAANDTIEAPYILSSANAKTTTERISFSAINTSYNSKGNYFTFELANIEAINEIELFINRVNYDWHVTLEGSQDLHEWFTILEDYRIVSIRNSQTEFTFSKLSFPSSKYRYYRVFVPSYDKISLRAELNRLVKDSNAAREKTYKISSQETAINKAQKQSEITLVLSEPVPINRLEIPVNDAIDYYRAVQIEYLADSTKTENGVHYRYQHLGGGTLNSLEKGRFTFNSTIVKELKITIQNQDNQPLNLGPIAVSGPIYELQFRINEPATYFLIYGNKSARFPAYDLAQFQQNIPHEIAAVTLGPEMQIAKKTVTTEPLFKNKLWLWAVMILIIGILGFFSLKMLRKS